MFDTQEQAVVIRFQVCIFDILNTAIIFVRYFVSEL